MAAGPGMSVALPNSQPPPYNGADSRSPEGWVCRVCSEQNPPWAEFCHVCGAGRPWPSAQAAAGSGAPSTSSGGHLGIPGSPPQSLYPLLTSSGEYYQGPLLPEKPLMPASGPVPGPSLPAQPVLVNVPPTAPTAPSLGSLLNSSEFRNRLQELRAAVNPAASEASSDNEWTESPPNLTPGPLASEPLATSTPRAQTEAPHVPGPPSRPPPPPKPEPKAEIWFPCHAQTYPSPSGFPVTLSVGYGDILTHRVGAVVNPANSQLSNTAGLAAQIVRLGGPYITADCKAHIAHHGLLAPGQTMATRAGCLPSDIIIHAVGPVYNHSDPEESRMVLRSTLRSVLIYAGQLTSDSMPRRTISFPLISSGIFGYPLGPCMEEHVKTLKEGLQDIEHNLQSVRIVCYQESGIEGVMPLVAQNMVPLMHTDVKPPPPPLSTPPRESTMSIQNEELVKYHPFTPVQIDAIVSKLPDPDKHPMQYVRKLEQIRQIYGATWSDLSGITAIKTSECFLPTMQKALDPSKAEPLNQYKSGVEYTDQLKKWAQDRLSDQAGSIQDVQQEPEETVEKYAARLNMHFEDLGYSTHVKTQAALLVGSFIDGLHDNLKEEVMTRRPEVCTLSFQEALTIVKAFQRALQKQDKESEKTKLKKKPAMYLGEATEPHTAPVMVYQAQERYQQPPPVDGPDVKWAIVNTDGPPPPPSYNRRPPQQYRDQRGRDPRGRPLCWECESPSHMRRDCPRMTHGRRAQGYDYHERPPPRQ